MSKAKRLFWIPLIVIIIASVMPAGVYAQNSEGTLALFDAFDDDHSVEVEKLNEAATCPDWPDFDLKLKITNVTDAVGAVWSIRYDSSLFAIVKADISVPPPADHWLYPPHPDGDVGGLLIDHLAAGEIGEACQIQLAPFAPKTFTDPDWGWVATLRFEYTGAAPAIGSPIDTDITIVNDPAPHCASQWTPDGTTWNNFTNLVACHFKYSAKPLTLESPTASWTIQESEPYYKDVDLTFDASASTGGCDGDDYTTISEYRWNFGDTTGTFTEPDPIITHKFTDKGVYTVTLEVWAPRIGGYDTAYDAMDTDTYADDVDIKELLPIGIDVYTEAERWPGYTAVLNGTGPDVDADAYSPQEEVTLYAYVYYKGDIVQNKLVGFEVWGPVNQIWRVYLAREATTDSNGIATISFRISWPYGYAEEQIFGTWEVWASASLAEVVYADYLSFEVGWIVKLANVITVDEYYNSKDVFAKDECVGVKMTVTNLAMGDRDAIVTFVIYDDVGAVVARYATLVTFHTGTQPYQIYCFLPIPKFAYCGANTIVYANAFWNWPQYGGTPWCPEVSHGFEIVP